MSPPHPKKTTDQPIHESCRSILRQIKIGILLEGCCRLAFSGNPSGEKQKQTKKPSVPKTPPMAVASSTSSGLKSIASRHRGSSRKASHLASGSVLGLEQEVPWDDMSLSHQKICRAPFSLSWSHGGLPVGVPRKPTEKGYPQKMTPISHTRKANYMWSLGRVLINPHVSLFLKRAGNTDHGCARRRTPSGV